MSRSLLLALTSAAALAAGCFHKQTINESKPNTEALEQLERIPTLLEPDPEECKRYEQELKKLLSEGPFEISEGNLPKASQIDDVSSGLEYCGYDISKIKMPNGKTLQELRKPALLVIFIHKAQETVDEACQKARKRSVEPEYKMLISFIPSDVTHQEFLNHITICQNPGSLRSVLNLLRQGYMSGAFHCAEELEKALKGPEDQLPNNLLLSCLNDDEQLLLENKSDHDKLYALIELNPNLAAAAVPNPWRLHLIL